MTDKRASIVITQIKTKCKCAFFALFNDWKRHLNNFDQSSTCVIIIHFGSYSVVEFNELLTADRYRSILPATLSVPIACYHSQDFNVFLIRKDSDNTREICSAIYLLLFPSWISHVSRVCSSSANFLAKDQRGKSVRSWDMLRTHTHTHTHIREGTRKRSFSENVFQLASSARRFSWRCRGSTAMFY